MRPGHVLAAWRQLSAGLLFGIALIPSLISELFVGIGGWLPWWAWFSVLAATVVLLLGFGVRRERLAARRDPQGRALARRLHDLAPITHVVATAALLAADTTREEAVHSLLRSAPSLRRVSLVLGERSQSEREEAVRRLRQWAEFHGAGHVEIEVLAVVPPYEATQDAQDALVGAFMRTDPATVVDVTGGTVPMSLTAFQAAIVAGRSVMYLVMRRPNGFAGAVLLRDASGLLFGAGL